MPIPTSLIPHLLRLDVYSHGIRVSRFSDTVRRYLVEFCHRFVQYGTVPTGRGGFETRPIKVYAAATKTRDEYFFHRNSLNDLLVFLRYCAIPDERILHIDHDLYVPASADLHWLDTTRVPRDYQLEAIEFFLRPDPRAKVLTLQTGKGKGQPLSAKIKTPGSWTTMGEVKVGDTITAKDGTPTIVVGIFPQGVKTVYRVTFADGRSCECDDTHLWRVYYVNTVKHRRWRVVNTVEMLRLISMPNPRVYVDLIDPEDGVDVKLHMDPYTLGILLGDGCTRGGTVKVSTPDEFVLDELRKVMPATLVIRPESGCDYRISRVEGSARSNEYMQKFHLLGLANKLSHQKFVPSMYLSASLQQRLALLQGLLDSDGTVQKSGSVSYCTTSKQLALNVQYLIRSIGGIAAIRPRQTYYTYKGVRTTGLLCYDVDIRYKKPSDLFRLPRKKERTNDANQYAEELKLRVTSIERVADQPTQCIMVDHPDHLYVTNDFIVTHNTAITLMTMARLKLRTALIIKSMYMDQWIKDAIKSFGLKKGDIVTVNGAKAMKDLISLAQDDPDFDPKFIVISNTTYRMFLRSYLDMPGTDLGYKCKPWEFFETLKVGLRVIDEVHMDFHLNFIIDTMTHCPKTISLSATLVSDDRFMNDMYALVFPPECHAPAPDTDRYIDVITMLYRFEDSTKIRFTNAMKQYSQVKFEQSIMKHRRILKNYVDMIVELSYHQWFVEREPGQKLAIFCGMKEMVEHVVAAMVIKYPDLKIRRFVDVDPDSHLEDCDAVVTTLQSCGTAKDIKGLKVVINTIALSSMQANQQLVGRLRRLQGWPEVTPKFIYLGDRGNPKHTAYMADKKDKLHGKIRNMNTMTTHFII